MSLGVTALLVGLLVTPLVLLWWSHHLRRRSVRQQRAFWGAITGHCVAGALAVTFGMVPPAAWSGSDGIRGFFGLWALLLFPVLAGLAAALRRP